MIETTIQKIRKDFSDQMIFMYCTGKRRLGVSVLSAKYDINNSEFTAKIMMPRVMQEMTIYSKAGGNPTKWHFSGDVKLEMKRPEVKFHD